MALRQHLAEDKFPRSAVAPLQIASWAWSRRLGGIYDDESKIISGHVLFPLGSGVCLGTFESWVWMCFNVNNRITGILYGAFLRGEKNNERM